MKYFVRTFGCQMNYSDSERISSVLEYLDFTPATSQKDADLLIFNTCSVRQKSEDRVFGLRKTLAALKKKNKNLKIAITGCMVRKTSTRRGAESEKIDPVLHVMPEIDIAFKIDNLLLLPDLLGQKNTLKNTPEVSDYFHILPKKETPFSVFVPIMTGCDKFCTYCIVPYARGREKSRDFDEIIAECKKHVEEGALEITLIGQTVNSYGLSFKDKQSGKFEHLGESPFAALLTEVDRLSALGLKRLRFTSPHPRDFNETLIETLPKLKTLCPHIHMPVQSGDDNVLRRMNRNYTVDEYKKIMRAIKKAIPNIAMSTDIIVGFCGETEEEFENTLRMYKEMEWDMCYLAQYSPRKGTYSYANLKNDVPAKTKLARWHRLNDLLTETARKKHAPFLGKTVEVLVSSQKGKTCTGRTPHEKEIQFESAKNLVGKIVSVKVTKVSNFYLTGELI
jgi:tRNA-2-methylthio-N6-dimethylallyladenosine synthase